MKILCIKTVMDQFGRNVLFTKGKEYDFVPVDNRYTRVTMKGYNFIGYIKKDDEGYKRWISEKFKNEYFTEVIDKQLKFVVGKEYYGK